MSLSTRTSQELEDTPDDVQSSSAVSRRRTPLPAGQIACLLLLRFCESASVFVVFPFLLELITLVIGGSKEKVGYYAGLMDSAGQIISLITVMYWSRLSDIIGRKPILLLGTAALAVSMVSFGLSKTFWGLVVSRCIFRALNSNAGVIKSVIGEITDSTNSADAFALLHVPWILGSSIGSLLGGWLVRPHEHFPTVFPGQFWKINPYFLPCATVAAMSVLGFSVAFGFLNETVPGCYFSRQPKENNCEPDLEPLLPHPHQETPKATIEEPVPLRDLLNLRVLIPVFNYLSIAFLHTSSNAIQPLFLAMPISLGGLEFNSRQIGTVLSTYGVATAIFQTFFLGLLVRRFGVKKVFLTSMVMFLPMFGLPPLMNVVARRGGGNGVIWFILICQQSSSMVMELGYGCIYMFITSSAPNKRSLGATNGLSQTLVAVARIVAQVFSTGLLSFSIEHNLFGGYAVYLALCVMTIGCLYLASRLPVG